VRDSLQVVSARELSLRLADYERYRADDARLIGELRADRKRIAGVVAIQQQTIRELQLPVEPTIIIREDRTVDTLRQISYSDRWLDCRAWEYPPDTMNVEIDSLRGISRTTDDAAAKIRESVEILAVKRISVNTDQFEHLSNRFIGEMERKLRKVKRPSKGLVWYIVMWVATLLSAFLAGYYIQETRKRKENSTYWNRRYEEMKKK